MNLPDRRQLALHKHVLLEPVQDERLILWLPGRRAEGHQHWNRISTMAPAPIKVEQGLCFVPASALPARQALGFFGRLLRRAAHDKQTWSVPNGRAAEQTDAKRTDLLVVWGEEPSCALTENRVRCVWPGCQRVEQVGENLFVVWGVTAVDRPVEPERPPTQEYPSSQAEQMLAAARQAGDRRREALALTDLGVSCFRNNNAKRAVALYEEALSIARELDERSMECDVLGNLAAAVLVTGQPQRALELVNLQLTHAREIGDRFEEKAALHRLGQAWSSMRDFVSARRFFEQALALAHEVGDRQDEAILLWSLAVQDAELGQTDKAVANAQAAIDLMKNIGHHQLGLFTDHLERFRLGQPGANLGGAPSGPIVAGTWGPSQTAARPPGVLRMALTAARAAVKFFGAGMKTVPADTRQERLAVCVGCEHHTGVRCRVCGCFTNVKVWLPHEDCPLGKWRAH
jgi:tetratricopeptide (TPR) repeat protein